MSWQILCIRLQNKLDMYKHNTKPKKVDQKQAREKWKKVSQVKSIKILFTTYFDFLGQFLHKSRRQIFSLFGCRNTFQNVNLLYFLWDFLIFIHFTTPIVKHFVGTIKTINYYGSLFFESILHNLDYDSVPL